MTYLSKKKPDFTTAQRHIESARDLAREGYYAEASLELNDTLLSLQTYPSFWPEFETFTETLGAAEDASHERSVPRSEFLSMCDDLLDVLQTMEERVEYTTLAVHEERFDPYHIF